MRLAFYLDDGLICGGAERVAHSLLSHWSDAGLDVYLISRRGAEADFYDQPPGIKRLSLMSPSGPPLPTKPERRSYRLPGRSLLRFVVEALRLRRLLVSIHPDIAIAFLTPGNAKLLAATRGLDCRVVVSERTDMRARRYPLMWRMLRRLLYPRAALVTANARDAIEVLSSYVRRDRLAWLPNPVHLPPEDEAIHRASPQLRMVSAGRLIPSKRNALLIEAFAMFCATHDEWRLDIYGDGPLHGELQAMIKERGLQHRVTLCGQVDDLDRHFRGSQIFVLPSAYEGTPNALLEAMAHGLPCVVSDSVSCAEDLVANTGAGMLFASGNPADLADKLAVLADCPSSRHSMGRNGRYTLACSPHADAHRLWDAAVLGTSEPSSEGMP
jgi:glycosyltransferase involved in cell wall biosynthesis